MGIRGADRKLQCSADKAFGAESTPIVWSETPTATQTGIVYGGDTSVFWLKAAKFKRITMHYAVEVETGVFPAMPYEVDVADEVPEPLSQYIQKVRQQ